TRRALSQKLQLGINLLTGRVSLPASQKRTESMSAQPEVWRVSTVEGIFETDLETLKQWIVEGCVLPTDKVCKGNLSWIDAGRVPKLKAAFSGERTPAPTQNVSFETFVESNPEFRSSPNYSTQSTAEPP